MPHFISHCSRYQNANTPHAVSLVFLVWVIFGKKPEIKSCVADSTDFKFIGQLAHTGLANMYFHGKGPMMKSLVSTS